MQARDNYDEDERRLELERIMNEPDDEDSDTDSPYPKQKMSTHSFDPRARTRRDEGLRGSVQVVQKSASAVGKQGFGEREFKSQQQRKIIKSTSEDGIESGSEVSDHEDLHQRSVSPQQHDRTKNRVTSVSGFQNPVKNTSSQSRSDDGNSDHEAHSSDSGASEPAVRPKHISEKKKIVHSADESSDNNDEDDDYNGSGGNLEDVLASETLSSTDAKKKKQSLLPTNPLDLVEIKLNTAMQREQENAKAPKKVLDFLTEDESDIEAFKELSNLQIGSLSDISGMLKPNLHGSISAFDILEKSHLVIGTTTSFIFVCNLIQKTSFGMGQNYKIECGAVESLAITEQNKVLLAGYTKGHVIIWNWEKYEVIHKIDSAFKSEVTLLKVVPSRDITFVGADQSANMTMFSIQDASYFGLSLFGGKVDKNLIMYGSGSKITQIEQGRVKSATGAEYNLLFAAKREGVTVVMLMPKPVITNTLTKPDQEPLSEPPSLSYRSEVNLNRGKTASQVLVVAWGYSIATYLLVLDPVNSGKLIIERANLVIFTEVINYLGFITPALVFCYKSTNVISCMKLGTLISQTLAKDVEEVFKEKMEVEPKFAGVYARQFKLQEPQKKIHVLHRGVIYHTSILSWSNAVLRLSQDKSNWKRSLIFFTKLYAGDFEYLADIPARPDSRKTILQNMLGPKIEEFFLTGYSSALGADGEVNVPLVRNIVSVAISMYINLDSFEFMFKVFYKACTERGLQKVFLEELRPFLLIGKIRTAPKEIVEAISKYYSEKKDGAHVVGHFLIHLDPESCEFNFLEEICIDKSLYYALFTISTRGLGGDYGRPAMKLYREFKHYQGLSNSSKSTELGHVILWYLRMLLRGVCLEKQISFEQFPTIISQIGIMFFNEEILTGMLKFNCDLSLSVYKSFFMMPIVDYLASNPSFSSALKIPGRVSANAEAGDLPTKMRHYLRFTILNKLTSNPAEKKELLRVFHRFQVSLLGPVYIEYSVEDIKEIVYTFVDEDLQQDTMGAENDSDELSASAALSPEHPDGEDLSPSPVALCLRFCGHKLSPPELAALEAKLLPYRHEEELAELRSLEKDYYKAYDILYSSRSRHKRRKVFTWFEYYLQKSDQESEDYMKELVVNQTKNLVILDQAKTQGLFQKFYRSGLLKAVRQLDKFPEIQYNFVKDLINDKDFSTLATDIKLEYLSIKCRVEPYKVAHEIVEREFPLEESLEICKRHNLADAVIVIYEKMGRAKEAVEAFILRFQKPDYLVDISARGFSSIVATLNRLLKKLEESEDMSKQQELLEQILKKMSKAIPYTVRSQYRKEMVQLMLPIMVKYLEGIEFVALANRSLRAEETGEHGDPPEDPMFEEARAKVTSLINEMSYNMTFDDYKTLLLAVFKTCKTDKFNWIQYEILNNSEATVLNVRAKSLKGAGIGSSVVCDECGTHVWSKNTMTILFQCKHVFHFDCLQKKGCPICEKLKSISKVLLSEGAKNMDWLVLQELAGLNAQLMITGITATVNLTAGITMKTFDAFKFLGTGAIQTVQLGASMFGDPDTKQSKEEQLQQKRLQEQFMQREKLNLIEKQDTMRLFDTMETERYDQRILNRMRHANKSVKVNLKEIINEVDDFEKQAYQRYSIRRLNNLKENSS